MTVHTIAPSLLEAADVAAMAPGSNAGAAHPVVEGGAKTNGAFLAAQVVDELRLLVAPALDGAEGVQGIVEYRNGLAGVVRLQFKSAQVLDHGVIELAYAVLGPEA